MWKRSIAYMSEVIGAFLRAECGHKGTDPARDADWLARLLFVDAP